MAKSRRRNTTAYSTYGSVAYAPAYDGNAVRAPRREEELRRAPRPKQREQVRRHERARVEVRKAGKVSLFAVVGFMAVAVFAVMLVARRGWPATPSSAWPTTRWWPSSGSCLSSRARTPS